MLQDIALELTADVIYKVPIFQDCELQFMHHLVNLLIPRLYSPGDIIVNVGDIGKEMYFVVRGEVEVIGDGGRVVATLKSMNYFGEIAMFFAARRTATVRARTFCDLFVLTRCGESAEKNRSAITLT